MRRLLALLLPLAVLAACGDDDGAEAGPTTTVADGADDDDDVEPDAVDEADADPDPDTSEPVAAPETTVPGDSPAGDGPADGAGEGDGMGDAVLAADLEGAGVVPGPGDPAATGRVEAEVVSGTLCVDMEVTGLDAAVTEAHLHAGAAGEEGPVLADIGPPSSADGTTSTWSDACVPVDDDVIEALAAAPERTHVDVHTGSRPDGAVRGQLAVISIFDRTLA